MPGTTPLTQAPTALLTDAANIETAVAPGLAHLEKFSIPRFSSLSARNAAFSAIEPEIGQVIYVSSLGHLGYQAWNGVEWEEFGEYTRMRTGLARKPSEQQINGTVMSNVTGLSFPVIAERAYHFRVSLFAFTETGDTNSDIATNFTFPGSASRCSSGGVGPGINATSAINSDAINVVNRTNRSSGDSRFEWGTFTGTTVHISIDGIVVMGSSGATGAFQVQASKRLSFDPLKIAANSYIEYQRVG